MVQKILVVSVKTEIPQKVLLFFHWDEPFHLNSPQNFQGEMVSAPYENLTATAVDTLLQGTPCYKGNY